MNVREACEDIMGEKLAASIITDPKLGLAWCVVAAMYDTRSARRPRACSVIRAWLAEQKIKHLHYVTEEAKSCCTWPDCDQPSGHDFCHKHCLDNAEHPAHSSMDGKTP